MILLEVSPTFDDEPKIVCKGFYEIKDTSISTWSLILGIRHYHWLHVLFH
jgi:hypothetical protein